MENNALLILLESVLGKGNKTSRGNYSFICPFCSHHKPKLEINLVTNIKKENPWHCWVCEARGKSIKTLFKQLKVPSNKFSELNLIIVPSQTEQNTHINDVIELPQEFIPLNDIKQLDKLTQIESKHALKFLYKRGLSINDIIKYNIGFCKDGKYGGRIIIPSYDENAKLNYFIARDYTESQPQKYKNPPIDTKSAIGWELYINWDAPIILIEGIFDALTVKRNVIPLFGKLINEKLMKKLVKSSVDRIYIALDPDAIKNALKHAEMLMSYGKEVYIVNIDGKDANEVGMASFLETIEKCKPLTFQSIIEMKLEKC